MSTPLQLGPRNRTTPYKMFVLLMYAEQDGFSRHVRPDGTVIVDVHWPTLRRLLHAPGGRMLKYLDWLLERKYVILVQRRRGYTTLALPPPVDWPVRVVPGPGGASPSEDQE